MLDAHSPKYPALYDLESGVRFRRGRAEVTEEQAHTLANRRFMDGITINGVPAKKWAADNRASRAADPTVKTEPEPRPEPLEPVAESAPRRKAKE